MLSWGFFYLGGTEAIEGSRGIFLMKNSLGTREEARAPGAELVPLRPVIPA